MTLGTFKLQGIEISTAGPAQAVDEVLNAAVERSALQVHLCNSYTMALARRDPKLRAALLESDLNLADGAPVAWLGRRFGCDGPVRGPSLLNDVARAGVSHAIRHYFWGGAPGVPALLAAELCARAPGLAVVGAESPPYRELNLTEIEAVAERVRTSGADILWVGLGTPRQDYLVPDFASRLGIAVIPVGAAFDFAAGTVQEAPSVLRGTGLEWAHRLMREPRRLWRRYLLDSPRFVLSELWSRWYHRRPRGEMQGCEGQRGLTDPL